MTGQQKKDFRVINGNSLDVLLTLEENSVDAIKEDEENKKKGQLNLFDFTYEE